jgi:hypothetical protein
LFLFVKPRSATGINTGKLTINKCHFNHYNQQIKPALYPALTFGPYHADWLGSVGQMATQSLPDGCAVEPRSVVEYLVVEYLLATHKRIPGRAGEFSVEQVPGKNPTRP